MHLRNLLTALTLPLVLLSGATACSDDPRYLTPEATIEGGLTDDMGQAVPATGSLTLPIRLEREEEAAERAELSAELGFEVPYVRLGDLAVSVEWSLMNLDATAGVARISLNGANPLFAYDPTVLILDEDDEAPEPPPLAGDIPIDVPASGRVSGVFREDQLLEASIDLEQVTRGNINPFRAMLVVDEDILEFQPMTPFDPTMPEVPPVPTGPPFPRRAMGGIVRVDLALAATTHMILTYSVRVRDSRGLLHADLQAAPAAELTTFEPAVYAPAAAP